MRKRHHKSRLGCLACKRRKIKCDEVKPQCGNCIQFSVHCDFTPSLQASATTRAAPPASRRGRPRSGWASWARQIALSSAPEPTSAALEISLVPLNKDDIEIYHHYITEAVATLVEPGDDHGARLWIQGVPRLGFTCPCILDLVLALSAYHMARSSSQTPVGAERLHVMAEQHITAALRQATVLLRHFDGSGSSPALYIISVLVCFTALGQGPRPGNLLLFASDGQVPWLSLLRGVRLVISTSGWSSIFSGPLAEYLPTAEMREGGDAHDGTGPPDVEAGHEDWRLSLKSVSDLADLCAQSEVKEQYRADLAMLEDCFEETFGNGGHARREHTGRMQSVMMWIYQLGEPLVKGLQEREHIPLLILGHFCVLLHTLRGYWFTKGWASHILDEILHVSEASRKWLAWPLQLVNSL